MKATKLPSGNYRAIAYLGMDDDGNRITKSFTAPDPQHAIALAAAYQDKYRLVRVKNSFQVNAQSFLRMKEATLSPSTFATYHSCLRTLKRFYPAFCAKNIIAINERDIAAIITDMRSVQPPRHTAHKEPVALSPKTIKNYVNFIAAVFHHAGVPMPHVDLPKQSVPTIYVPSDEEIRILIDAVKGTDLYIPVLLAAFAPLRRGEICALQYPRDFQGNVIHVQEAIARDINRKSVTKAPKTTSSNRFIELPPFVIDAIKEQGYVTHLSPNLITSRFPHALKQAGLPHFRFHDLRHWCISTLHAQGVADVSIQRRAGHATDAMLKRVYRHTLEDQDRLQTKKALDHFQKIFDIS